MGYNIPGYENRFLSRTAANPGINRLSNDVDGSNRRGGDNFGGEKRIEVPEFEGFRWYDGGVVLREREQIWPVGDHGSLALVRMHASNIFSMGRSDLEGRN